MPLLIINSTESDKSWLAVGYHTHPVFQVPVFVFFKGFFPFAANFNFLDTVPFPEKKKVVKKIYELEESCAKFGISPNKEEYFAGREEGIAVSAVCLVEVDA